jgi:hypothetical protein
MLGGDDDRLPDHIYAAFGVPPETEEEALARRQRREGPPPRAKAGRRASAANKGRRATSDFAVRKASKARKGHPARYLSSSSGVRTKSITGAMSSPMTARRSRRSKIRRKLRTVMIGC